MDEFAFHENSEAIWDAAEPIISSNRDFLCRVASTGNGRYNKFYQLASISPSAPLDENGFPVSEAGCPVSRVTRTQAHALGVAIYDAISRRAVSPAEARRAALDKRSYDQNYECSFHEENMALLTLGADRRRGGNRARRLPTGRERLARRHPRLPAQPARTAEHRDRRRPFA